LSSVCTLPRPEPSRDGPTAAPETAPAAAEFHHTQSERFVALLHQLGAALLVSTYQANKLLVVRVHPGSHLRPPDGAGRRRLAGGSRPDKHQIIGSVQPRRPLSGDRRRPPPLSGRRHIALQRRPGRNSHLGRAYLSCAQLTAVRSQRVRSRTWATRLSVGERRTRLQREMALAEHDYQVYWRQIALGAVLTVALFWLTCYWNRRACRWRC
jgi:hypothetical protein